MDSKKIMKFAATTLSLAVAVAAGMWLNDIRVKAISSKV